MKFEMLKEKKNPAMKRDEHLIGLEHKGKATPSRPEIMKEVAKLLKTKEDLIIVDRIASNKGLQSSMVHVLSYRKRDDVPKYKLDKMNARMEKARAKKDAAKEKQADAPKEEKAEEKSEEHRAEEPKQEEEKPVEEDTETGEQAKE